MKKIAISILCIILSALLFTGCSTPALKISNTYKFGYTTDDANKQYEHFEYNIAAAEQTFNENTVKPIYYLVGSGTYNVDLYYVSDNIFKLTTDFSFTGQYKYTADDSYSEEFTDTITGESFFTIEIENFTATSSVKTYNTSIPKYKNNVFSVEKASYTVSSTYTKTDKGYKMVATVADSNIEGNKKIATDKNSNYTSEITGRFYDNEQIFTGLRVQNISTAFSDSFYVFDPLNAMVQKLNVSASTTTDNKNLGLAPYTCVVLTASINSIYKGSDIVMYYTQDYAVKYMKADGVTPMDNTTNASLLLEFKHGDLLYTLSDYVNFASKADA